MSQNKPLSEKQADFCRHYVANGFNGTQAAISAGYSAETANEQAAQLLAKLSIKEEVERLKAKAVEKSRKGAEDVYNMAANAAFFDIGEYLEIEGDSVYLKQGKLSDLPKDLRILIQAIKQKPTKFGTLVEIVFVDKLKALEMLARFNGMNKDKLEVSSNLTPDERAARIAELRAKMEGDGSK